MKYFEGTPIPTSVLLVLVLAVAAWRGRLGADLWFGALDARPGQLAPAGADVRGLGQPDDQQDHAHPQAVSWSDPAMTGPHPDFLRDFAETRAFSLGRPGAPADHARRGGGAVPAQPARAPAHDLFELDVASGQVAAAGGRRGSAGRAASEELISPEEQARRERLRITDSGFTWLRSCRPTARRCCCRFGGRLFLVGRQDGARPAADRRPGRRRRIDPRFSPDGSRIAFVRERRPATCWSSATAGGDPGAPGRSPPGPRDDRFRTAWRSSWPRRRWAATRATGGRPTATAWPSPRWIRAGVERFAIADPARPERAPLRLPLPAARAGQRPGAPGPGRRPAAGASRAPPPVWVAWDQRALPLPGPGVVGQRRAPRWPCWCRRRDQREVALLAVDRGDRRHPAAGGRERSPTG